METAMATKNRQFVLANYPEGLPSESTWRMVETPMPEPKDGEILVRALWLSVDPYMRGRISPSKGYTKGVSPGEVMQGGGVGSVIASRNPKFKPGDVVESMAFGWQEYPVLKAEGTRLLDPALGPIRHALGVLGMPGLTAYFALLEIGQPKAGETVVVSAASGAVGSLVGQIAKLHGCRTVAIAGDDAKLAWCREKLGYDSGLNHRTTGDLAAALAQAAPKGVDVFFDNTAGPIHDAVMQNLAMRARVIICGTVAITSKPGPDIGPRWLRQILINRARVQGFLVFDYVDRYADGLRQIGAWLEAGKLVWREDIMAGFENTPKALIRVLKGENFGKQLVRVVDTDAG
jgi:NADPH-dependent curcumin reductase CurA